MGFRFWTGRGWGWEGRFYDAPTVIRSFETLMRSIWEERRKARQGKANDAMRCDAIHTTLPPTFSKTFSLCGISMEWKYWVQVVVALLCKNPRVEFFFILTASSAARGRHGREGFNGRFMTSKLISTI